MNWHPHGMVKCANRSRRQNATAVTDGAWSKLHSKPAEPHGNAPTACVELCACEGRQASPHGQALNLCSGGAGCSRLATGVPGLALGSVEIGPCCAVLCCAVRLCLVCAAACLHIQEPPDNLTVAIFPVNFRTDQILTCFPAAMWRWVSGMHPVRSDGGRLYLPHECAHFVC